MNTATFQDSFLDKVSTFALLAAAALSVLMQVALMMQ